MTFPSLPYRGGGGIKPFRDNNKRKKRITISERKGQKYNTREKRIIIRE